MSSNYEKTYIVPFKKNEFDFKISSTIGPEKKILILYDVPIYAKQICRKIFFIGSILQNISISQDQFSTFSIYIEIINFNLQSYINYKNLIISLINIPI